LDLSETFRYDKYMVRRGDSVSSIAAKHSLSVSSIIASNSISNAKRLMAGTVLKIPNMDGLPHKVRRGDTLSGVASSYGIPVEAILDANDLDSETIHPGMTLFLPGARMRGEELRRVLGDLFVYPVRGRLTSGYGWRNDPFTGVRRFHAAIDLAAPLGTPLTAAMDGRVSTLGFNSVYGKYIILSHSGGYQTLYAHLNDSESRAVPR
jgi:murein DD-endopeptidase MepM/ murein hydrolase activator NlpD